ncbi:nucleotide disphospho-sugar-binding domain-containing protein [Myceligenerans indicum]|uniref:DUF1205 domain-containing protein n=1 Tax=Myceligenerans indicum TaxID=2593663 RepID=A0ABS1LHB7_9MICO|nr:nucleotide disphospho-sugar-binding domain-containing protein [Myceligenerans indicum]MBL0885621.1 DUF1205 domain-containing protein [Myceligenerans indicum]
MRILFIAPPALRSHLYLQVPLVWALRGEGHEVAVAVHPDLADARADVGLAGPTVGIDMLETLGRIDANEPAHTRTDGPAPHQRDYAAADPGAELEYLNTHFLSQLCEPRLLADLVDFGRAWRPDLIVWDQLCYAGGALASILGVPHVRLLFGTDGIGQLVQAAGTGYDPVHAWLDPLIERHGGRPAADRATGMLGIDTMPPWTWRPEGDYLRMRHLAYNGPSTWTPELFRQRERPLVLITLGLSHEQAGVAHASSTALLDGVADLDADVVATVADDGRTAVPANVTLTRFVPLGAALPHCAALVHQGGSGTFAAAYEAGTPQLVVPSTYWSDRWFGPVTQTRGLVDEGAGEFVADSDHLDADRLHQALQRVLKDTGYADNAARLRADYQAVPSPNATAARLTEIVRG